MSESITIAGGAITRHLIAAERASDTIVHDIAALSMTMIEARQMAKLQVSTGQRALSYLAEAQMHAIKARSMLVSAHARLAADATELGFDWTMFGDEAPTPRFPNENRSVTAPVAELVD